jgi:transposase
MVTAVYIAVMGLLLVRQFSKTKNVVNGQKTPAMPYLRIRKTSAKQQIKFGSIIVANYEVSRAWQVRENIKDLFSSGKLFAWTLFNKWTADSKKKNLKEIDKVIETFNNHISGVVNALIMNLSNAMTERLNGKIQELKTVGKGYRTFSKFRSAILFFNGGLDLYTH